MSVIGDLNLKVSKADFERRIDLIDLRMNTLASVVESYNNAKRNLDQFIEGSDDNYEAMCANIDMYIKNAKSAHGLLAGMKDELKRAVSEMDDMHTNVKETITAATEAVASTVQAVYRVKTIL
jgi:methyl-accepting chemotaxis protein